jgi:hypothetical protein
MYFTGALVIVGGLQFVGLIWQAILLRKTREEVSRQANSMETQAGRMSSQIEEMKAQTLVAQTSANAALLNAKAVINAERPWLLVQTKPLIGPMGGFNVFARNKGRTPAMITAVHMGCVAVESINALPTPAPYGSANLMKDRIIIPGQRINVIWFDGRSLRHTLGDKYPASSWDGKVCVFGKIVYRDLANPSLHEVHETRWIGLYQPPSGDEGDSIFPLEGIGIPEEYDRYT